MSVQLDIRVIVEAAMLLVPWPCLKLAFVFYQMVLKLPCSPLKTLSAVQNTLRAVKEVFHNYSDVDGELGNGKHPMLECMCIAFAFYFTSFFKFHAFGKCLDILDAWNGCCIVSPKHILPVKYLCH